MEERKEDLLKMLRDAEMDDEAIAGLLKECLAEVEKPAEDEQPQETEDEKTDGGAWMRGNVRDSGMFGHSEKCGVFRLYRP